MTTAPAASSLPSLSLDPARTRAIFTLALPIILGMMSQNVLNLVDSWMVARLGTVAQAAVTQGNFANFMAQAFVMGLSAGVQAMASRRKGEGRLNEMALPLNGGLLMALALSLPITVTTHFLAPWFFPYLNSDPEVVAAGIPYLQLRLWATAAVGMNFAFRGYWNGIGRSSGYLQSLVVMHISNIILSWSLIFGHLGLPAMGLNGAGLGTTIATYIGTLWYMGLSFREARQAGFLREAPGMDSMRVLLRTSLPAGMQQFLFSAGFNVLFWIVARVGTREVAAGGVILNLTLVALLPGLGLGLASASLVGQALGRGDSQDAERWGWDVVKVAVLCMGVLGLPMALFPDLVLGEFLKDPDVLALARTPLRLVGLAISFDAVGMVLLNALMGAGDTKRVMYVSTGLQWGLFLPVAFWVGPVMGGGLLAIWSAQVAYRSLTAVVFGYLWLQGRWKAIRV